MAKEFPRLAITATAPASVDEKALVPSPTPSTAEMVHAILEWRIRGGSGHEIQQATKVNFPGVGVEQMGPLIVEALEQIRLAGNPDLQMERGWAILASKSIYSAAMSAGDNATALRAAKQVHDIATKAAPSVKRSSPNSSSIDSQNGNSSFDFLDALPISPPRKASGGGRKRRKAAT